MKNLVTKHDSVACKIFRNEMSAFLLLSLLFSETFQSNLILFIRRWWTRNIPKTSIWTLINILWLCLYFAPNQFRKNLSPIRDMLSWIYFIKKALSNCSLNILTKLKMLSAGIISSLRIITSSVLSNAIFRKLLSAK